MATAAKPGATTKPGETVEASAPPPKKSKKLLFIIIVMLLMIGSGATTYFLVKPSTPTKKATDDTANDESTAKNATNGENQDSSEEKKVIKYISLGTFTANLIHEEGDRYLQVAISIKVSKPELEEKFKESNPEILHHVNMLLQSRRPSELATLEGKEKLASDLKAKIERVLGFSMMAPVNNSTQPVSAPSAAQPPQAKTGIEEVLFTSFIIQ